MAFAPPGRGKLTLRYKGKQFLVASNLGGELWPVFNMDNIGEQVRLQPRFVSIHSDSKPSFWLILGLFCLCFGVQLSIDFVIDDVDGNGTAIIRKKLEVPNRKTSDSLFHRVDADSSGLVSLTEATEMLHDFYPELELVVIIRAFQAADTDDGYAGGRLDRSSFRKLFEYLIFYNNMAHLFEQIDESGDGMLSLAEFKVGAHLIEPSIPDEDIDADFAKMDEDDEEQGEVTMEDFCKWMAVRVVGAPAGATRPSSAKA